MTQWSTYLADEAATVAQGRCLGVAIQDAGGAVVYLDGTLGAGKTTLCRGVLSAFGHEGAVKSPTYTLVEPYTFDQPEKKVTVYHFDLYRLSDPEELEFLGIRDYFSPESICLFEWPSRGEGCIPDADLLVNLNTEGEGRKLTINSCSERGVSLLTQLQP